MEKIKLTKDEKKVLRLLSKHGAASLDTIARSRARRALRSLEEKSLTKAAWIEGGDFEAVRLTRDGRDYLIENPKLRNPINWSLIIPTVVSILAVISSIIVGCVACAKL